MTLSAAEAAEYAGRYADPGSDFTLEPSNGQLEATVQTHHRANSWEPAVMPPPPPPAALAFLGKDMAKHRGARLPFVRDDGGSVGWVGSGFRLVPRIVAS